eukprot:CAMPEP_0197289904 /NCGR_PEP_ID=MMETSP0890-20130614/7172_1 /TAXON_ID=44058 ORGANISM="Aureoumbra lagunensis, Strain CCMP1510" /NCGR_SAMPLE_ID=MMETSP0890 /ASSEMBLY_ACC=CAM_ASM_000533 /LENGTH=255 /DNA_ID=CAMNT_0042761611 /DNA_START=106 /DNA_END=873 /DNA_ORIENTATION=-
MAAFHMALNLGADGFECDIQELADGNLIILHDTNLWRTSGAQWYWIFFWPLTTIRLLRSAQKLRLKDVLNVDVGSWFDKRFAKERIPTFAQVASLAKEANSHCFAELKTPCTSNLVHSAVQAVKNVPVNTITWISFDLDLLLQIKKLDSQRKVLYIVQVQNSENAMKAAKTCIDAGLDGLDLNAETYAVTPDLVKFLHDNNKLVAVWVYSAPAADNDTEEMRKYMEDIGVDFFTSNLPPLLTELPPDLGQESNTI